MLKSFFPIFFGWLFIYTEWTAFIELMRRRLMALEWRISIGIYQLVLLLWWISVISAASVVVGAAENWLNIKIDRPTNWVSECERTSVKIVCWVHMRVCVSLCIRTCQSKSNAHAIHCRPIASNFPRSVNEKKSFFWHRNNVLSKSIYIGSMNT